VLADESEGVFVRSWAIVSLCIIGKKYPSLKKQIAGILTKFKEDKKLSIRVKVAKTLACLENNEPIPKGWQKSKA
jgi:HEAT repeat protein